MTDHPSALVSVPRAHLEWVRDLLMERVHGSAARSPGHNARLEVEAMLAAAPAAPQAAGVEDSTTPPPHWTDENAYDRHPKTAANWNWRNDPPLHDGGLDLAVRRLNFAGDRADPRAPDQMALVLRKDLINVKHELLRQTALASLRAPSREPEGGAVMRQALERIGYRDMRRELGAGDYGADRTRCPSCGHAWDDGKPEHHAAECALKIAQAALTTREEAPAEKTDCERCAGNGEIVTDWDEYLSPSEGAPADHATADCPVCGGIGNVEAPAEAGEDDGLFLLMKRDLYYRPNAMGYTGIKDHAGRYTKAEAESHACALSGVTAIAAIDAPDFSPACFDDLARAHLAGKLEQATRELSVLRAQPPAREDAQPVGGGYDPGDVRYGLHLIANEECDEVAASYYAKKALGHIYTHPAPDALRVAVEALESIRMMRSDRKPGSYPKTYKGGFDAASDVVADWATKALAAMQAEQGAK